MCLKRSEHKESRTLIYSHNPDFKGLEFDAFKNEAEGNAFTMSPQKWITATNTKGIISKSSRYGGGAYAHSDIALATQKLK